jgi:enterochelin esterase-like enzyme
MRGVRCYLLIVLALATLSAPAAAVQFEVTFDPHVAAQPVSGRLYVFLSQRGNQEPRFGPDWFHPEPFFRVDVTDLKPGGKCIIDDAAAGFPDRLSRLPLGEYRAQAVLANSIYSAEPGRGAGNLYSHTQPIFVAAGQAVTVAITLDQTVAEPKLPEVPWIKPIEIKSQLLSAFHHREIVDRAAVILPAGYSADANRRFPVLYVVPSFGGSYREAWGMFHTAPQADAGQPEFIRVVLDGLCEWGHHVYADSATNGPRGESLIKEMIPEIDHRFRTVASPDARFLAGHSSGGWSSLWLQVAYPETFGGVWSTSPDPVDFHDFQRIDLYADPPQNMYVDLQGQRRPLARHGETPALYFDSFTHMDDVLGRGGQLRSFEAVFSPMDSAGLPKKMWDRATGRVDPAVAKAWEPYDIRSKLERNWPTLGPKLQGKLHITTGSLDTFYLDGAVVRMHDSLKQLGSDAEITVVPGADHMTVLTPDYFQKSRRQMAEAFRKNFPAPVQNGP